MASLMAFSRLFLLRFRKKLTVMGIMGQTQGVMSAANPQRKPFSKMLHREPAAGSSVPRALSSSITGDQSASVSIFSVETVDAKSASRGSAACSWLVPETPVPGEGAVAGLSPAGEAADAATASDAGSWAAVNEKSTGRGGVQVWSLHACARTFPSTEKFCLSVTRSFCEKVTDPVKVPISISKISSYFTVAFLSVDPNSPTSSAPVRLSNSIIVGVGPPSGIWVSYMYHPCWMVALATMFTSPFPASSNEKSHERGLCAIEGKADRSRKAITGNIFIRLIRVV